MPEDRRGLARRVDQLERQLRDLTQTMQRVELEQAHVREVIDSRFRALDKGQEMLLLKFDGISTMLSAMAGDPQASPMGRVLAERLAVAKDETDTRMRQLETQHEEDEKRLDSLKTRADVLEGAIGFARASGIAGMLLAVGSIVLALLKLYVVAGKP